MIIEFRLCWPTLMKLTPLNQAAMMAISPISPQTIRRARSAWPAPGPRGDPEQELGEEERHHPERSTAKSPLHERWCDCLRIIDQPFGQQLIDARLYLRRRRYGASHGVGLLHRLTGLEGTYAVLLTAPTRLFTAVLRRNPPVSHTLTWASAGGLFAALEAGGRSARSFALLLLVAEVPGRDEQAGSEDDDPHGGRVDDERTGRDAQSERDLAGAVDRERKPDDHGENRQRSTPLGVCQPGLNLGLELGDASATIRKSRRPSAIEASAAIPSVPVTAPRRSLSASGSPPVSA